MQLSILSKQENNLIDFPEIRMTMKLSLYIRRSLIAFSFLSFSTWASNNPDPNMDPLTEAIIQTYSAIHAIEVNSIIQHAEIAKIHAKATKNDIYQKVDHRLLDYGIESLNNVVTEVNSGNIEAAREAAHNALVFITQSAQ
jgi:hypothetical protein